MKKVVKKKTNKEKLPVFIIAFVGTLLLVCGGIYLFKGTDAFGGSFNAISNNNRVNVKDDGTNVNSTSSTLKNCWCITNYISSSEFANDFCVTSNGRTTKSRCSCGMAGVATAVWQNNKPKCPYTYYDGTCECQTTKYVGWCEKVEESNVSSCSKCAAYQNCVKQTKGGKDSYKCVEQQYQYKESSKYSSCSKVLGKGWTGTLKKEKWSIACGNKSNCREACKVISYDNVNGNTGKPIGGSCVKKK